MKIFRIGIFETLEKRISAFSFVERMLFYTFVVLLCISAIGILGKLNATLLVTQPAPGGSLAEGIIGAPRFVNPLLALSDADRDMTALVYSGLLKADPDDRFVLDLASDYSISEDGLVYTVSIREDATFHDGTTVTADDVVFTITLAQTDILKSPKRANWQGIEVVATDTRTVQFTLSQPFAPFLENLTLGILPAHIWKQAQYEQVPFSTYNTEPIGSGPYKIQKVLRDDLGVPEAYVLEAFDDYVLGRPFIDEIVMRFYANENALRDAFAEGDVTHINALASEQLATLTRDDVRVETFPLPRVFGVFFNQSEADVFTEQAVRQALNESIDRERIVAETFGGYGQPLTAALPHNVLENTPIPQNLVRAAELLDAAGWTLQGTSTVRTNENDVPLQFALATSDAPELQTTALLLQEQWRALGVDVELDIYETGSLNQNVIRPRRYQALLFGQIIGRSPDPFAFWHSSQLDDPGLNVAGYANITADEILETIRITQDMETQKELYAAFDAEVQNDVPAIFLYSPDFIYVVDERLQGFRHGTITTPAERFLSVHTWHLKTQHVWPFFVNE